MTEKKFYRAKDYILEKQLRDRAASARELEDSESYGRIRKNRKRILIISDTHGFYRDVEPVLRKVKPINYMIHCGDVSGDEDYIREAAAYIAECPCSIVRGNNDFGRNLPEEEVMTIAGHKILVAHGHHYGISYDSSALKKHAKELGATIVCCGHTHVPMIDERDRNVLLINPGSLALPRQSGRERSYAMLELGEDGFRFAWICYLPNERNSGFRRW